MDEEFPYSKEKANILPYIARPLATVKMSNQGNEITQEMYVDSGADITVIPYSVCLALGFALKPEEEMIKMSGIGGGNISIVLRHVTIEIGENSFGARIAWCMSEGVPLILGRLDVFERFTIIFKENEGKVIFKDPKDTKTKHT